DGAWSGRAAAAIASFAGAGPICNPIDGGNLRDWKQLDTLLPAIEADGLRGPLLAFLHMLPQVAIDHSIIRSLVQRKARTGAPSVVVAPGGLRGEIEEQYAHERIPVFHDLATCFDSLRCLYDELGFASEPARSEQALPLARPAETLALLQQAAGARRGFLS